MWPLLYTCPLGFWVNFVGWFLTSSGTAKGTSLLVLLSFKILVGGFSVVDIKLKVQSMLVLWAKH